jgi:hypothetical protein
MTIETLIGIKNCTLVVYCDLNRYRFSITNTKSQTYTCDSSFPTSSSAKLMGIAAVERLAIERDYR